jgi:iron(III) transport system permease protein
MLKPRVMGQYAVALVLLLVLGAGLLYPIAMTVRVGFADDVSQVSGWTLRHVALVFQDPMLREGLLTSARIAVCVTVLSTLLALPLAVLSAKYKFFGKGLWSAAVLVPLILPPFVGALGLKMLLGRSGAVNALLGTDWDILGAGRFWGVVVAEALSLFPIIYLNATAALANIDPALEEAAENAGAGPWRRFFTITLPLIRPGLFAGGTIVLVWSFTELGTPLMFDYLTVTPVQIFFGIKEAGTNALPYALTVVMLGCAVAMYLVGKTLLGGRAHAMYAKASRASAEKSLGPVGTLIATAMFACVTGLALLPHLGVILMAFSVDGSWYRTVLPGEYTMDHIRQALGHPLAFGSIVMSLKLASAAVLLNLVLGLVIGYVVVRTKVRGRGVLDALAMLPLAVPGLVMAFGYVAISLRWPFGDADPLAGWVDVVGAQPNPVPLLIVAYAIRRMPYIVRATVAGLEQTSGELEEAAVNLGAGTLRVARTVIVPLISANLIAGALLAFSFSMLEVSDSMILAQQEKNFPITKAIFSFSERLGDGVSIASAMGVWGMALLTVTLVGASIFMGKRLGAMFRV